MKKFNGDISIVLAGSAGQGVQTLQFILADILRLENYHIFSTIEYMSRVRGGINSTEIRISDKKVNSYLNRIDLFVPLERESLVRYKKRITKNTIILNEEMVPFSKISRELGNNIYENSVVIGFILGLFNIKFKIISDYLTKHFGAKHKNIKENLLAAKKGYDYSKKFENKIKINIQNKSKDNLFVGGTRSVALGAIAGGCNFICSYPMSPSTGVLIELAKYSKDMDILVEQVEDEISAINMALGSWYAGGRALVTTSGGGFDLMTEGLSLSGMLETPVVVHIAQRPGPATGLPTRTGQEDLNLAVYAGHGEYPRMVIAPGDAEEAFYLTQKAFNIADKYQIPVLILTDQFLVDSFYNIDKLNVNKTKIDKFIVKTSENYKRYKLTKNISPRGIPGYGSGFVNVDSDEHTEEGHITEDHDLRIKMMDKRLNKLKLFEDEISPELIGSKNYKTLIIGWGSTKHSIREALEKIDNKNISFLHFKQVYPISSKTLNYFKKAKKLIIVENNATCQFGQLLELKTGYRFNSKILKYNGISFSVEELIEKIRSCK